MRIRTIKPEFFKHDGLGSMPATHRILFAGLWCMADCAGRLEDRPIRIKVEVLPYDDLDVDKALTELAAAGFIIRYQVDQQRLIEVVSFSRHQRISGKEAEQESRYPGPEMVKAQRKKGKQPGSNGDSPGITGREGKGKEGKDTAFAEFWSVYPKKKAKDEARKAFEKIDSPLPLLLACVERAKADPDWLKDGGKYIPYPATWLNGKRWEDEVGLELFAPQPATPTVPAAAFKTIQDIRAETRAAEELEERRLAGEA